MNNDYYWRLILPFGINDERLNHAIPRFDFRPIGMPWRIVEPRLRPILGEKRLCREDQSEGQDAAFHRNQDIDFTMSWRLPSDCGQSMHQCSSCRNRAKRYRKK